MWLPIRQKLRHRQRRIPDDAREDREVSLPVKVVDEDRLADSAAVVHVVDAAGELGAKGTRHARQ